MLATGEYALTALIAVQPIPATTTTTQTAQVQYQQPPTMTDPIYQEIITDDVVENAEILPEETPYLPEQPFTDIDLPLIPDAPPAAKPAQPATQTAKITDSGVTLEYCNIRETPSVAGKIIRKLPKGTAVKIIDSVGAYYKVQEPDMVGYIFKDQIKTEYAKPLAFDLSKAKVLATYTTKFSKGDINRNHNMEKAAVSASGLLKAGETFSYLKRVGRAGKADGYLPAGVISGGKLVTGYGGGICQPSSTLYAALLQDKTKKLTVIERHAHSLKVGYLPRGMDATVSNPSADFRFRNDTGSDIYIDLVTNAYKGTVTATYYLLN